MKVLFIHFLEDIGGGERYLTNVINALPKEYDVFLLTPNSNTKLDQQINRKIKKLSKKFSRNIGPFPSFSISLFLEVKKIIKNEEIEVIHLLDHYLIPTLIFIKYLFGVKVVFASRGLWDVHFFINRLVLKLLNPVLLVSTPIQYFRVKSFVKNIYLLPSFYGKTREIRGSKLNEKINLSIVGRFSPVKNHFLAFDIVNSMNSNYVLNVFGDKTLDIIEESSEYNDVLVTEISKSNKIVHHGRISDVEKIYTNTDILLVTSKSESFSMVTIEALSFGIPVLSTLTEGSTFLLNDGYNGFICRSKDEFIEKIVIIKNDYKKFSRNAFESSEKFSKDIYINKLIDIYENKI